MPSHKSLFMGRRFSPCFINWMRERVFTVFIDIVVVEPAFSPADLAKILMGKELCFFENTPYCIKIALK